MKRPREKRYSRRHVLTLAAAAASGAAVFPRSSGRPRWARAGRSPPASGSRSASIGIGRMGQGHLAGFLRYPMCRSAASAMWTMAPRSCEGDGRPRLRGASKTGESGGCPAFTDLRELISRETIDAVVITTGDRWHVPAACSRPRAGKDIYCEKPMSLTIREARVMADVGAPLWSRFSDGPPATLDARVPPGLRHGQKGRIGKVKFVYVSFPA